MSASLPPAVLTCLLVWCGPLAYAQQFSGLGGELQLFDDRPDFRSEAYGVSSDGTVAVGRTTGNGEEFNYAFRHSEVDGLEKLVLSEHSGEDFEVAFSVSQDGLLVGGLNSPQYSPSLVKPEPASRSAFRWQLRNETAVVDDWGVESRFGVGSTSWPIEAFVLSTSNDGVIAGVNIIGATQDGSVVSGSHGLEIPIRAANGKWHSVPSAFFTVDAFPAVSPDGNYIAAGNRFLSNVRNNPFPDFFPNSIAGQLGEPITRQVESRAITDSGVVAGFIEHDVQFNSTDPSVSREAFWWSEAEGTTMLGHLRDSDINTIATDVSNDGKIVVGRSVDEHTMSSIIDDVSNLDSAAFIWTEERGMMSLQEVLTRDYGLGEELAGWTLKAARAITPDGRVVVGGGTNPAGEYEAFRAVLELDVARRRYGLRRRRRPDRLLHPQGELFRRRRTRRTRLPRPGQLQRRRDRRPRRLQPPQSQLRRPATHQRRRTGTERGLVLPSGPIACRRYKSYGVVTAFLTPRTNSSNRSGR